MFWLFKLASFTGAFPLQVNGINALGSLLAQKITYRPVTKTKTFSWLTKFQAL